MGKWAFLAGAIVGEVVGSLSMQAATDAPVFFALVAAGYVISFVLYAGSLRRGMALSVASSIWAASGVLLTAVLAAALFDERFVATTATGVLLIAAGVVLVVTGARGRRGLPQPAAADRLES